MTANPSDMIATSPKSTAIGDLLVVADAYVLATGRGRGSLSKAIFDRGGHFEDLAIGSRDLSTGTFERAMQWFSNNWPDNAVWPEGVARPEPKMEPRDAAE